MCHTNFISRTSSERPNESFAILTNKAWVCKSWEKLDQSFAKLTWSEFPWGQQTVPLPHGFSMRAVILFLSMLGVTSLWNHAVDFLSYGIADFCSDCFDFELADKVRRHGHWSVCPRRHSTIVFVFAGRGIDARLSGAETAGRTDGEVGETKSDVDVTCDKSLLSLTSWEQNSCINQWLPFFLGIWVFFRICFFFTFFIHLCLMSHLT